MRITIVPATIISMTMFFSLVFTSCKEAFLPLLTRDVSLTYDLTTPYEIQDGSATYFLNVNPVGIAIKSTKERSDGSIYIMLGGTSVINGIPDALHEIYYPPNTKTYKQTDYPIGDKTSPPAVLPVPVTDKRSLENSIALKSVSRNSKYTAVTISGVVNAGSFIQISEENNSLRLLTQYYIDGYNAPSALFNTNRNPMFKDLVYYKNPNLFSENGFNPNFEIYRGRQSQQGGFNVLIWDGASPKQATFSISYDNGRTFKRTVVDWSMVTFAEIPVTDLEWEMVPASPDLVQPSYQKFTNVTLMSPGNYDATVTISEYPGDTTPLYPPPSSIAEGLQPIFTPSNATNKNFYFEEGNYSVVSMGSYSKFELADRVRISAIQGAGQGADQFSLHLITGWDSTHTIPTVVKLTVNVTVGP